MNAVNRYKEGEKVCQTTSDPLANPDDNPQTIDDLLEQHTDTEWIIKWTEALDFDSYVSDWMEMATSGAVRRAFFCFGYCDTLINKCIAPGALKLTKSDLTALNADNLEAEIVQNEDQIEPRLRPQSATLSEVFPRETDSVF
jgi:hypothetical protein